MAVINKYIFDNNFNDSVGSDDLTESGTVTLSDSNPSGIASHFTASGFSNTNELDLDPTTFAAAFNASGEGTIEAGFILNTTGIPSAKAIWGAIDGSATTRRHDIFIANTTIQVLLPAAAGGANSGAVAATVKKGTYYTVMFNWDATNWTVRLFNHTTQTYETVINNAAHGITPSFTDIDEASIGQLPTFANFFWTQHITHVVIHDSREDNITIEEVSQPLVMMRWGSSHVQGFTQSTTEDGMRTAWRAIFTADRTFAPLFAGPSTTGTVDFTPKHSGGSTPMGEIANIVGRMTANIEAEIGNDDTSRFVLYIGPQSTHDFVAGTSEVDYKDGLDDAVTKRDVEAASSPIFFVTGPISPDFDPSTYNTWMKEEFDVLIGAGNTNLFFIDLASINPEIGPDDTHMNDTGYDEAGTFEANETLAVLAPSSGNPAAFDSHGKRGRR